MEYFYYTPHSLSANVLTLTLFPESMRSTVMLIASSFVVSCCFQSLEISYFAKVARYLYSRLAQHFKSITPQRGDTVSKLKYYILSRART